MSADLRRITGLWRRTSKRGLRFWSGPLDAQGMETIVELARGGPIRLYLFATEDPGEGEPVLRLCAAPDRERGAGLGRTADAPRGGRAEP